MLSTTATACEQPAENGTQAEPAGTKQGSAIPVSIVILLIFLRFSLASDIFAVLLFNELPIVQSLHFPLSP